MISDTALIRIPLKGYLIPDHEKMTQEIITCPETEIYQVLIQVAPDFPQR